MIVYQLNCTNGHAFSSFFKNHESFEKLNQQKLIECVHCGDHHITKQLSSPHVVSSKMKKRAQDPKSIALEAESRPESDLHSLTHSPELSQKIAELKEYILKNHEDVGDAFCEVARKIHYGETAKRNIMGTAHSNEISELWEEGIQVLPAPFLDNRKKN